VGTRQNNRAQADSVTSCSAFDAGAIAAFLEARWALRDQVDQAYGQGQASTQFVSVLQTAAYWVQPPQKAFAENFQ